MPRRRRWRALSLLPLVALTAGCFTGHRPHFEDADTPPDTARSGDPNIDAVLERLDTVGAATFTARYDVLTRFGVIDTSVVVSQAGPDRRSVTIADVRYLREGDDTATCALDTGECREGLDESRVSDVQLNSQFFTRSAAAKLRGAARGKISASTATTATFAGQQATCVDVPVSGGVTTYCALDDGVLAAINDGAYAVTLIEYSATVDESLFTRPTPG